MCDVRGQRLQEPNEKGGIVRDPIDDDLDNENIIIDETSTLSRRKGCWYSIDISGAKLNPQSVADYFMGQRSPENGDKLRRHLFAMGWKIERKVERKRNMSCYRYLSHDGVRYYSLITVCQHLLTTQGFITEVRGEQVLSPRRLKEKNSCNSIATVGKNAPLLTLVEEQVTRRKRSRRGQLVLGHSSNMVEEELIGSNCSVASLSKMSIHLPGFIAEEQGNGNNWSPFDSGKLAFQHFSHVIGEERGLESNFYSCMSSKTVPLASTIEEEKINGNTHVPCGNITEAIEYSNNVVEEVQCIETNRSPVSSVKEMSMPSPGIAQEWQSIGNNRCFSDGRLWVPDHSSDVVEETKGIGSNPFHAAGNANEMLIPLPDIGQEGQCIGYNCSLSGRNIKMLRHSGSLVEEEQGTESTYILHYKRSRLKRSDDVFVEKECCPQAVEDYCKLELRKGNFKKKDLKDAKQLILKVKMHLSFDGWKFWYVHKTNKRELRYCSPKGNIYGSLITACKAWMKDEMFSGSYDGLAADKNPNGSQFSQVPNTEFHESSFGLAPSIEELLHQSNPCSIRKGSPDELPLPPSCNRTKTSQVDDEFHTEFHENSFGLAPSMEKPPVSSFCNRTESSVVDDSPNSQKQKYPKISCVLFNQGGVLDDESDPKHVLEPPVASSCNGTERPAIDDSDSRKQKNPKESCVLFNQGGVLDRSDSKHVLATRRKTILPLLIDSGVVSPGQEVAYLNKRDHHPMAKGQITYEGIKCNCCRKVYGLSNFEVHAGSTNRRPAANIFLQDGRSLLHCQSQIAGDRSDGICCVCYDGGGLLLCASCPSVFHSSCVGLEDIPQGEWYCPSCRCGICGEGDFNETSEYYTEKTVIYCDQCKREYHVGCLRERELAELKRCPKGNWFCDTKCSKIFACLQELVGKINPTDVEGLTWTVLRSEKENRHSVDTSAVGCRTKYHKKLLVACRVLHECFERMTDPCTNRDIIMDIVFNNESDLNQTNYSGFYTMLLERKDEIFSVATIRIFSEKVVEMPLIGTRFKYRRQGMCHLLMNNLEKMLSGLGVERLLLPSPPSLLETWTGSFGFTKITRSERLQFLQHNYMEFQGTVLCQKLLTTSTKTEMGPRGKSPHEATNGFDSPRRAESTVNEEWINEVLDLDFDGEYTHRRRLEPSRLSDPMMMLESLPQINDGDLSSSRIELRH
ncbi:hypothetical protein MRB53_002411 [Persea americana]|uniref:Uncharacterized protein n=1 Tax=Persea americana TaxID=3435 RepID=A0ACC2MUS4_PERAE|nr:hypothetical protein MRB53_002411 [Persea americana]